MNFVRRFFTNKYLLFSFLLLGGILLFAPGVLAQGDTFGIKSVGGFLPLGGEDPRIIVAKILRIVLSLLGIIAVVLMLYAGFTWMTSNGNEEKIATSKKILVNATIGLVIVMSSFAITQFVLKSLQDATGSGDGQENNGAGGGPVGVCANFADCQANGGPRECGDEGFVVKSLTPRTSANDGTGMTNTVIRAVFSRPLDAEQNPNKIFRLTKGTDAIAVRNILILPGRQVVEAYFDQQTELCKGNDARSCLVPGDYTVEVNPDISAAGIKLQTRLNCGEFDNKANFRINRDFLDGQKPSIPSMTFNGRNAAAVQNVARNAKYRVNATFDDRKKDANGTSFGGVSYMHLKVESQPKDAGAARADWSYYSGPKSGSNNAFSFSQDLAFGAELPVPALYALTFTVGDIDSNKTVATSSFVLDGELCHNGRQDAGENGVDIGGACLGDGQCNADWQCLAGECGADGRCVNKPVIQNVDVGGADPDSWDGAPGSWATIIGNFFGENAGNVDFGIDNNNDGTVDQWVGARLADCAGLDMWTDRQIIVEIPNIPAGTSSTLRVRTPALADKPAAEDLSTDNHGPKSGPNAGIFKITNNDRPGLCAVLGPNNTNVATSTAPITAFGRALGNGQNSALLFGGVAAPVRQWGEQTILSSVPQNMRSGRVGVRAKIGDVFTNGVEFLVVDQDANLLPQVDSISPYPTTTVGSLVTLSGARFGAHGTVYLAPTRQAVVACAETRVAAEEAACQKLDLLTLPDACGNTWGDNQIIGKIPAGLGLGQYFVAVKNEAGLHSDGERDITLVAGAPLPGLCRLEPNTGVAPLPENARPLSLTGINLNPNPELYFWTVGSNWLVSSRDRDPKGNNVIKSVDAKGTNIQTVLPIGNNGVSVVTGPLLARVAGNFSNSVRYTVNDCTLGGNAPGENYQCCAAGPERGMWKPEGFACAGETRSAGYVWRFTTGLIPQVPRVLEACNVEEWNDLQVENFARPSPSPWDNWNTGDACTDSVVTVQFNMRMSEVNLNNQVKVYTCGQGASPDCSYDDQTDVTDRYTPAFIPGQTDILELRLAPGATHATGTWHRVILGNNLRANEPGLLEFNQNKINTSQLSLQRTFEDPVNGITVAYNFDFKTGEAKCSLLGAAITPPTYTTRLLGVIQNTGFPISPNFDNPPHPFYFYVWGRGKQACSVIDVNGKGWQWKPRQNNNADAGSDFAYATKSDNTNVAVTSSQYYKDVRAKATALQNTLLSPVYITASTNTLIDGVNKEVVATSTLFVQLGDPVVTEWWPECSESCVNATIGVRFNLPMITSTYRTADGGSAIKVEKCLGIGENCVNLEPLPEVEDINPGAFDPFEYSVTIPGNLATGTLYQVTVTDQIRSFGGILNGNIVVGRSLIPKVWKFRTKIQDGICILDTVDVLPSPYVATMVGQKTPYAASPMSSPNQCSPAGQRLNPWSYGWNWRVQNEEIASITEFATKATPPAYCSASCLPTGSTVPFGQTAFMCGNGSVDPGEDCDVAQPGEIPGVSCSLSCLRPGNTNVTSTRNPAAVGLCGNGALERAFGEECDPGIEGHRQYCSNTCTWTGSDQQFSGEVNALQCGNGHIGLGEDGLINLGEDCDLGITLAEATANGNPAFSQLGCSNRCLHLGTRMSRAYCSDPASNLTQEQRESAACYNAITVCGNNALELGEECELLPGDNNHIKVFGANGAERVIEVESARAACSNRCILKDICDVRANVSPNFTCQAGTPGCTDSCTRRGSSPLYETPSLCGDGVTGIGENPQCEPVALADIEPIGQDPLQIVTAVGESEPNPATLMQETIISAQATQVRESRATSTPLGNRSITGTGNYAIQCGFVEYDEPRIENGVVSANNCTDQSQGVDNNSCCQVRPSRTSEYPAHGSGLVDNTLVCQNTFISADFDKVLDQASLPDAVMIARLHPGGYNCSTSGETDITRDVNNLFALSGEAEFSQSIFARMWDAMKDFFVSIFESVVHAQIGAPNMNVAVQKALDGKVWCTGRVMTSNTIEPKFNADGTPNGSTLGISITDILDPATTYAVILRGGKNGLKDVRGVGIRGQELLKNANRFHTDDIFVFKTGKQICKIENVSVDPDSHLFTTPSSTHKFGTIVQSTSGGPIVSTPSYAWQWNWEPSNSKIFRLGPPANADTINISSTGLEGNQIIAAQAIITEDRSEVGNEVGRIFVGLTDITSLFCENPWPSQATYPYEDGISAQAVFKPGQINNDHFDIVKNRFDGGPIAPIVLGGKREYLNFSFGYCADSGSQGNKQDDLPFLRPVVQGNMAHVAVCSISGLACLKDIDCPAVRNGGFLQPQRCVQGREENVGDLPAGTLKKFLLFNDKNQDVIGVQVFENIDRLSARDWFNSKGFSGIERYRDIVVDGYSAISDGSTIYISALNELSDKRIHSYIYLFGINDNAQTNTRQVLEKIIARLKFNINIPERNSCVRGNGVSGGQYLPSNLSNIAVSPIDCSSDYECRSSVGAPNPATNGLCANAKTKFQSDWQRLVLVRDVQTKLETYRANNGQYPTLLAGTYIPGYTNSHWPSWSRLLEAIGPVAQPPLNQWSGCGRCSIPQNGQFNACSTNEDCGEGAGTCVLPDDPQTCWNSAEATFSCPVMSNVLEYNVDLSNNNSYQLYLPLEYFNPREASYRTIIQGFASTTSYNTVASCGGEGIEVVRAAAGSCGNGIREAGEKCDPAGTSRVAGNINCPAGQSAFQTCNDRCQYDDPVCRPVASCGNGRVDNGETCDDGNLNNTYGHCNSSCSGQSAAFCGNGTRDFDDKNTNNIQDAGEGFLEFCDKNEARFKSVGFCEFNPRKECTLHWMEGGERCEVDEGECISKDDPTYHIFPTTANGQSISCSNDCQAAGGYCGDGQLQLPSEQCDDNNDQNGDGCSSVCKIENIACVNSLAPQNIQTVNNNTRITIDYGDDNTAASCQDTNGESICNAVGLRCGDVLSEELVEIEQGDDAPCNLGDIGCIPQARVGNSRFDFLSMGALSCQRNLNTDLNKRVQVECRGVRPNAPVVAAAGSCGNGQVNEGEVCDTGATNGQKCNPEYGRNCSYCSADCREVLTVDPIAACGNGKIDIDGRLPVVNGLYQPEVCDIDPQTNQVVIRNFQNLPAGGLAQSVYQALYNGQSGPAQCADRGTFSCENNCQRLVTNCVSCGYADNAGKPVPKLKVLNVLTPNVDQPNNGWGQSTARNLVRLNTDSVPSGIQSFSGAGGWGAGEAGVREDPELPAGDRRKWRNYLQGFNTVNYNNPSWLFVTKHGFPSDAGYGFKTSPNQNGPWQNAPLEETVRGIESNALCKDDYSVYFNLLDVTVTLGGTRDNPSAIMRLAGAKAQYERYGSFFPYPVSGELREIQNEYIISPAVPQGTFRVVVKWKNLPDNSVVFTPLIYNRDFLSPNNAQNATNEERLQSTVSYARAVAQPRRAVPAGVDLGANPSWLCSRMAQHVATKYWLPNDCIPFNYEGVAQMGAGGINLNKSGGIYVHEHGSLANVSASAMTVFTGNYLGNPSTGVHNAPYAIFVEAFAQQGSLPISTFNNMDVTVEVYDYREGQMPESSIYQPRPTNVFKLSSARASSNDGIAKYWHAFNLVKDRTGNYQITPVAEQQAGGQSYRDGVQATNFADVLCRVPGENCNRDQ